MNPLIQFDVIGAIIGVIALLLLLVGFKLLASPSWILGWLRGNIGILFLVLTGVVGLSIVDIRTYKPMFDDRTIVTLTFKQTSPNNFDVLVVDDRGIEKHYPLAGDTWRLSLNLYKWSTRFNGMGVKHGYRLATLSSKYLVTPVNPDSPAQDIVLATSKYLDVWKFFNQHMPEEFFVSARLVMVPTQPMVDGAIYEVVPSGILLEVKPVNDIAKQAIGN